MADSVPPSRTRRWGLTLFGLAAIAVTGGVGVATATSPDGASAYVPISPCRLADTRAGTHNVGGRDTPLGADEAWTLDGHGEQGNCSGPSALPANATGLQLNVTAVNATDPTFIALYPAGGERPTASNLNPMPDSPAVPNAVTVKLADDGRFAVYNRFGSVDVIVDVVGFYTDHDHDDRYYTRDEVDALMEGAVETDEPWMLDVPSGAMRVFGSSTEAAAYKVLPSGESGGIQIAFHLPEEYAAGSDVLVDTAMLTGSATECDVRLMIVSGGTTITRISTAEALTGSMEFVSPSAPDEPSLLTVVLTPDESPFMPFNVATRISGADLEPGDWVEVTIGRLGTDDTCNEVFPIGATIREA